MNFWLPDYYESVKKNKDLSWSSVWLRFIVWQKTLGLFVPLSLSLSLSGLQNHLLYALIRVCSGDITTFPCIGHANYIGALQEPLSDEIRRTQK